MIEDLKVWQSEILCQDKLKGSQLAQLVVCATLDLGSCEFKLHTGCEVPYNRHAVIFQK